MSKPHELLPYGCSPTGEKTPATLSHKALLRPKTLMVLLRDLFGRWLTSRPGAVRLGGVPAGIAVVAIGIGYVHWSSGASVWNRAGYEQRMQQAFAAEQWEAAAVYSAALLERYPEDPTYRYGQALILQATDQPAMAEAILNDLAPVDGSGHQPARFLIARQAIERGDLRTARLQMERAVEEQPRDPAARQMLGKLMLAQGDAEEALVQLQEAARAVPALLPTLAQLYGQLGRLDEARRNWDAAAKHFQKEWNEEGSLVAAQRLTQALVATEQFAEAEPVLLALVKRSESEEARRLLADLYVLWSRDFRDSGDWRNHWRLLARALDVSPRHVPTLVDIAELAQTDTEEADRAAEHIRSLLADGQAPAAVHLLLGTRAAQKGEFDEAQYHLEQARAHDARTPAILNNLAWVLASDEDAPRLDEALALVDEALKLTPRDANCHDTRGMILMKQGRATDAVHEFELAVQGNPSREDYLERLADAYAQAGDTKSADAVRAKLAAIEEG